MDCPRWWTRHWNRFLTRKINVLITNLQCNCSIVSSYEIKYSDDATKLFDSTFNASYGSWMITQEHVLNGSLIPSESGSVQTFDCFLPDAAADRPYFVALRAVDKAQKIGPVSNLAAFYIPIPQYNVEDEGDSSEETDVDEVVRVRDDLMVDLEEDIVHEFNHQLSAVALGLGIVLAFCLAGTVLWIVIKRVRRPDPYTMVSA